MAFHGVFIGIDRHLSPHVGDLTCAVRDAKALAALFEDTLGGSCTLLTDADATREAVIRHLDALSACHPDDTVFVAFSGHGTDDHKLVTHDTDLDDLEGTALSLVELERKFINIQAGRLLLVLDCCFSGGMGAKVLKVDARSRSPSSAELRLAALAGEGRLILTASAADQPAWEDVRRGHGLLTSALVEALSGTPEVMDGTHVSLMRLVAHVVSRVQASAIAMGKDQSPGVRAAIEGDVRWPVFVRGARWEQWFPAPARAYVDHDPSSLARVGFPTGLVAAWSKEISSLNDLQVEAINDYGILRGEHLVVSAPTSSGKTMVGELAALTAVISNRRAIFLLPLKALVADKRRHFTRLYGPYGVRTFEATGETDDIGPLLRGKYDIALLTYEKFCAVAVRFPACPVRCRRHRRRRSTDARGHPSRRKPRVPTYPCSHAQANWRRASDRGLVGRRRRRCGPRGMARRSPATPHRETRPPRRGLDPPGRKLPALGGGIRRRGYDHGEGVPPTTDRQQQGLDHPPSPQLGGRGTASHRLQGTQGRSERLCRIPGRFPRVAAGGGGGRLSARKGSIPFDARAPRVLGRGRGLPPLGPDTG